MNEAEVYLGLVLVLSVLYIVYRYRNDDSDKKRLSTRSSAGTPCLYSVPVNDNPAERKLKFYENDQNSLMKYLFEDAKTMLGAVQRGCRVSNNGFFLGKINREKEIVEWTTYKDALTRMKHFGDGLIALGQIPVKSVIGIYSINRVEYAIAEFGCYWHSMVIAPIYNTLGPNVCTFIANQAEIEVIVCDTLAHVEGVLSQASSMTHLKHIISMEPLSVSCLKEARKLQIQILTIKQLEQLGQDNPAEPHHPEPSNEAVICYTSGTTGTPKGVIHTHENVVSASSGLVYQTYEHIMVPSDVFLSYLPLAHIMERVCEVSHHMVGAKIAYFSGDIPTIAKDIQIAKPTVLLAVPRLLNKIYDKIYDNVRGNPLKEWMLRTALAVKQRAFLEDRQSRNTIWDKLIFDKIRNNLGGRIRILATGSASLDPRVGEVIRNVLGCVLTNGYGQTECCACTLSIPTDTKTDTVGPPITSALIKLVDLPEMNYFASEGKGEIMIKGPIVSKGYYKDPVKTKEVFEEDGWMHTGDVGAWTPEGNLQIVDRVKNHFKLALGEFIPVEKLELSYGQSLFVGQIFVYGDSARDYLVAIVVPEMDYLASWCKKNKLAVNLKDKKIKTAILEDLRNIAEQEKFNKFEYIKRIHLHPDLFSIESGLITPTMKLKRFEMQKYFSKIIENLYRN